MNTQFEYKGQKVEIIEAGRSGFNLIIDKRFRDLYGSIRQAVRYAKGIIDAEEGDESLQK
jgi:hypothetical protein